MAEDELAETMSLAKRLEKAKRELDERKQAGKRFDSIAGGASKSGGSAANGTVQRGKARASSASRSDRDNSRTSRSDEDSSGLDRKGDSGYSPNGGRVSREHRGSSQASGQDAREAPLLKFRDDSVKALKRALTYAGFDLKGDSRALSEAEIEEYRPQVALFFKRVGVALDWGVTHTNKNKAESEIWVFEDDEADKLADIYLKRARKIGWMAEVARQVRHLEDVGDASEVASILGKRIVATGMFYPSNGGFGGWM